MADALGLLHELGVTSPKEIDVNAIAAHCGAHVQYRELEGCEARLVGNGDRAIISVSNASNARRQRFDVGHELGHWLWDRGRVSFVCKRNDIGTRATRLNREPRANGFAADLLMPGYLFDPLARDREMTIDTAVDLGDAFDTSLQATALRLVTQGTRPAAIVVTNELVRDWYRLGPDVPDAFRPHLNLQAGAGPLHLLKSGEPRTEPTAVSASTWIEHPGAEQYELVEQCQRVFENKIVTMLWWQDESQIVDYLDEEE